MEDLILAIGSTSGGDVDKFDHFDVATCAPGGGELKKVGTVPDKTEGQMKKHKTSKKESAMQEVASAAAQSIALRDCVAHVLCRVNALTEEHGHLLLRCTQLAGWTRRTYWDGRNFIPQVGTDAKPYLTFLGSRTFAYVLPSGSANLPPTGPADV